MRNLNNTKLLLPAHLVLAFWRAKNHPVLLHRDGMATACYSDTCHMIIRATLVYAHLVLALGAAGATPCCNEMELAMACA